MNGGGDSSELGPYRALRERDLRREGLFIAEGRLAVERLLASGWELLSVLCTPGQEAHFAALSGRRCPLLVRSEEVLASLAGFPFHRGVLAAGRRPRLPALAAFLDSRQTSGAPLTLVVCLRLSNSENLGSIVRSAAAFGAAALALGERSCDPLSRKAIKVSAATVFRLPLVDLGEEQAAAGLLPERGFELLGASAGPGPAPPQPAGSGPVRPDGGHSASGLEAGAGGRTVLLPHYRRPARLAVVFGNEASGLEEPWRSGCHRLLAVPMPGGVDSLNVAVAAGIIMWELGGRARGPGGTYQTV